MQFCIDGVNQSIVRKRSRALVLYICLIALYCARLEIEVARVYLVNFVVIIFRSCFGARVAGREQDYKRRSPTVGLHLLRAVFAPISLAQDFRPQSRRLRL